MVSLAISDEQKSVVEQIEKKIKSGNLDNLKVFEDFEFLQKKAHTSQISKLIARPESSWWNFQRIYSLNEFLNSSFMIIMMLLALHFCQYVITTQAIASA